ncbi:hypothetical protein [Oceanidesulfovibrio marinus]|uniref:Uncharacterized protein n=1 Tax=Oceanidesulfovibrio marinus TaxID=370038 RepID=A0ABX6NFM3_9BACT|nr:hypothetical protein [Oceanidesulfovibrio marinus]QJT09421.1 hypothetical protein E8L03_10925 [Oceanidesulfovibrio marinus]
MQQFTQLPTLLSRLGILAAVCGLLGLALFTRQQSDGVLVVSLFALCVAGLCFSVESILERRDNVRTSNYGTHVYVYGFQAVSRGFSAALLCCVALAALGAWMFGFSEALTAWIGSHPGSIAAVGGVWLASAQAGTVAGAALSTLDAPDGNAASRAVNVFNMLVEKLIAVLLTLVGTALFIVGCIALAHGWRTGDILTHILP